MKIAIWLPLVQGVAIGTMDSQPPLPPIAVSVCWSRSANDHSEPNQIVSHTFSLYFWPDTLEDMACGSTSKVKFDEADFFVHESGDGPALVCLHAGVADQRMFDDQHLSFSEVANVISYDRRGFGQTISQDVPFSHVDDLAAIMTTCKIETAVLVGCSQGGRIAIDFALKYPGRVSGLFLIAPDVSGVPRFELPQDLIALEEALKLAYEVEDLDRINELEAYAWLDGPRSTFGRVTGPARELFLEMNKTALAHSELTEERKPQSAWARLAEIVVPVRVYCGDLDFPYMHEIAAYLANQTPHGEFVALRGVAHMPFLESPKLMNQTIEAFLKSR